MADVARKQRDAIRRAVAHVELVRKLVDHEIHSRALEVARAQDVGPRQQHRSTLPRFAGDFVIANVDDAGLVLVFDPRTELVRIDDDVAPPIVSIGVETKHENARLDRDDHAHQRRHLEVPGADDCLVGEEQHDAIAKLDHRCIIVAREKRQHCHRVIPQLVGQRMRGKNALATPAAI